MDTLEKHLKSSVQKIRLRAVERRVLRERVVSYVEYHQLPASVRAVFETKNKKKTSHSGTAYTEQFSYIRFSVSRWHIQSLVGVLGLVFFVGIPLAAERSVPGEVLYAVKVHINEVAYGSLSFSSFEKVAWETRRVERRIAEARLLVKEGKLTDEVEAQITETVKAHAENAHKELAELRESDADEAAVAQVVLESALDVQTAVLETKNGSTTAEEDAQIQQLVSTVRDVKEIVRVDGTENPTLSSYDRFSAEIESATTRARELFLSIEPSVTEDERTEVDRRLQDIDRRTEAARKSYEQNASGDAIDALKSILSDTQKVISFMTDIDVRRAVELETLVPKVPTLEERRVALKDLSKKIKIGLETVRARLPIINDAAITEKLTITLDELAPDSARIDTTLESNTDELDNAEAIASRTWIIVEDMLNITGGTDLGAVIMRPETAPDSSVLTEGDSATSTESTTSSTTSETDVSSTTLSTQ